MSSRRNAFLAEMGISPLWSRRDAETTGVAAQALEVAPLAEILVDDKHPPLTVVAPIPGQSAVSEAKFDAPTTMDWDGLESAVPACQRCGLCRTRTRTVLGVGDRKASWLFVGEGPGYNEDLQGEPFVGAAGKLLDNMMLAMGLRRGENAYIANIVKCRATDADGRDRPPTPDEAAACRPYLERQIALIQPAVIVALGKSAAVSLLGLDPDIAVSRLRGSVHRYGDVPVVVTYHPAYLLRQLADKGKAWSDLCLAVSVHGERAA